MIRSALGLMLVLAGCDEGVGLDDAGVQVDGGSAEDAGPAEDGGQERDAALPPTCAAGSARIEERCEPALVPCGGEVAGAHCYAEVCFEKDELLREALMQPGVPDGCTIDSVELRGSTGTIEGSITFSGTGVSRSVTSTVTGTFWMPAECQIVADNCDVTESFFNGALGPSGWATCEADAGGCECDIELEWEAEDSSTYTIEGNTIVTGGGRRFDYCVESGGEVRFREDAEPGLSTVRPAGD